MSIKSEAKLPGWVISGVLPRNVFTHKGYILATDAQKYAEKKPLEKETPLTICNNPKFTPWQKELARAIHDGQHVIVDVVTSCGKTWATNLIVSHEVLSRGNNTTVLIVTPNVEVMRECIHDISVNHVKKYRYPTCRMLDSTSRNFMTYTEKRPPISQIMVVSAENFLDFITNSLNEEFMKRARYIVFDEVHLPTISSGLWWSQYIPQCAQLILLSATIGNCDYIVSVVDKLNTTYPGRPRKIQTIKWDIRPIPLQYVLYKGPAVPLKTESSSDESSDEDEEESSDEEEPRAVDLTLSEGFAPKRHVRAGRLDLIINPRAPTARDLKALNKDLPVPTGRAEQHALAKTLIPANKALIKEKLQTSIELAVVDPTPDTIYQLLSYLFSNEMQPVMVFHGTTSGAITLCEKLVAFIENVERKDPQWVKSMKLFKQYEKEQQAFRDKQYSEKKKKSRRNEDDANDDQPEIDAQPESCIDIFNVLKQVQKWKFPNNVGKFPDNLPNWVKAALENGIGVYVSTMPQWIRHYMFDTFKEGRLKILIADSAISVGINLPIRTVVVCGNDIQQSTFEQVSGRAGRQGFENQGYVIPMFTKEKIVNYILAESKPCNIVLPRSMTYSELIRLNVPENLDTYFIGDVFSSGLLPVSPYKIGILNNYVRTLAPEERGSFTDQIDLIKSEQWNYHRLTNVLKVLTGNETILFMRVLITGILHNFSIWDLLEFIALLFERVETEQGYQPLQGYPDLLKSLQVHGDKYGLGLDFSKPIHNYLVRFCKDGHMEYQERIDRIGDWLYALKTEISKIAPATDKFRVLIEKTDAQYLLAKKKTI